jgi:hypothetical protein
MGPMTGKPNFNYPAFFIAEQSLSYKWDGKYEVENPARNFKGRKDLAWTTYLRESIRQLTRCEYVYKLPGWWKSKGCLLESLIACALKINRIYDAN